MPTRRSFKSDISFLEKISMGAVGTRRVFDDLIDRGHNPIELERGSRSFKIWKQIKIKRIRVPDILCAACARRFESRAKTTFEVTMSHSLSDPERGWDYGLGDEDFVALVRCRRVGERPIDWQADQLVQYLSVEELRSAQIHNRAAMVKPKGAGEGFEARIIWPAIIAKAPGAVISVTDERIQYRRDSGSRTITLQLARKGMVLQPWVTEGEAVVENQILAGVVPVIRTIPCSKSVSSANYIAGLQSPSLSERYTAAKALAFIHSPDTLDALARKISESSEHIYVCLEAAAGLARHDDERGWEFIKRCLTDVYLQNRLEAVIVLGEIRSSVSNELLASVLLDREQHSEIRAGAAWALGELRDQASLASLLESFAAVDESIRVEAARALAKLASQHAAAIALAFPSGSSEQRAGIAWALSRAERLKIDDLLGCLVDDDARRWVAYILGSQEQQRYVQEIERLKARDPEVYFAVTVLWQIVASWIYNLEEYG